MKAKYPIKLQKAAMLLTLIEKYGETGMDTGSMHIILDDGNFGTSCVEICKKNAIEENDFWAETMSNLLAEFTDEEQEQIVDRPWEISEQIYG